MAACPRKLHRITRILSVVSCGCETWSATLREKRKPRVLEKDLGLRGRKQIRNGEKFTVWSFTLLIKYCLVDQIIIFFKYFVACIVTVE
jgi:hypothetical protein